MESYKIVLTHLISTLDQMPPVLCEIIAQYTFISDTDRVYMLLNDMNIYRVRDRTTWLKIQRNHYYYGKFWINSSFASVDNNISAAGVVRRLKKRYWMTYLKYPERYTHKQYKTQVALAPLWEEMYQRWLSF